jgi:prolipoprotein diacylglyceryltransferase
VIKWIAVHKYCNVDLHLYNLIFVLVAYEALILHNRKRTEKGGGEKLEEVFLFVFVFVLLTIVGTIYILSSAIILQCLKDFYQEYSQKNFFFLEPIILKTPTAPFQTPHL